MKKVISLLLALGVTCSLALPAAAATSKTADERLSEVTAKVKQQLALETGDYESFNGYLEEGAALPVWNLSWSGADGELQITATESGKILSYYLRNGTEPYGVYNAPSLSFPKLSRADAQKIAQGFLGKVLEKNVETAKFEHGTDFSSLSATNHSFYGTVLENGLPSPFSFRMSVRISDGVVTSYYLNGNPEQYLGGLPSDKPAADAAKASDLLKSVLALRLEYVWDENQEGSAVLRYLPEPSDAFYVDGQTGVLVNLTELYQKLWNEGGTYGGLGNGESASDAGAAPSASDRNELTEAEQEGIAKLEGVLSRDALDAAARKWNALGLGKYKLSTMNYWVDDKSGDVTARLQYARKDGDNVYRRYVSLDGKTGVLKAVSSSSPWIDRPEGTVNSAQAQSKAEAFLKQLCPAQFAQTALYRQDVSNVCSFTYAQKENGYFFPASSIYISIDPEDGAVSGYSSSYLEDVTFQSAEGVISAEAALGAWFSTYHVTLGYQAVPEKLNLSAPEYQPLIERGVSYLLAQKLGWILEREGFYLGIDAKTGKAVQHDPVQNKGIIYSDLEGSWVKTQAEQLAAYGVGWLGGTFRPSQTLTQRDLVALLVSTRGYLYDPQGGEAAANDLYSQAYSMGILTKNARNDSAVMTRGALVKLLLDSAGYADVAKLQGIFRCSFSDESSIPAEYYGYAALAQGLGIVGGAQGGRFDAGGTATRAEGAAMLFNLLRR